MIVRHSPLAIRPGFSLPGVEFNISFDGKFHATSKKYEGLK